jgi:hypothetical protein
MRIAGNETMNRNNMFQSRKNGSGCSGGEGAKSGMGLKRALNKRGRKATAIAKI